LTPADRALLERRGMLWAIAVALAVIAFGLLVVAKTTDLLPGAAELARSKYPPNTGSRMLDAIRGAEAIGTTPTVVATVLAVLLFAYRTGGVRVALLGAAAGAVVLVASWAKDVGPVTTLPSGHAAYAASVLGFAAWLNFRLGLRVGGLLMAVVAVSLAPARVLDGAHWPMDVVAGFAMGLAWLLAVLLMGGPWAVARRSGALGGRGQ
jgi:membrane-associated phospholipid phosphatase